jgi:NTP pyrophosphatase (non-canonical NTP hydrolase)
MDRSLGMQTLAGICKECNRVASEHGWWDDDHGDSDPMSQYVYATKLALISSEVSEAIEDLRANDMTHFGEELADIAIRLFDLSVQLDVDLDMEIKRKMEINKGRPYKHGKCF